MIKTIDEALKVLNERNFKEKEWRFGEDPCYVVSVNKFGLITVYEHDDAIAFARQLNGDYEALERQVQRLREAAGRVIGSLDNFVECVFCGCNQEKGFGHKLDCEGVALAITLKAFEEEDSGDTLSANQS